MSQGPMLESSTNVIDMSVVQDGHLFKTSFFVHAFLCPWEKQEAGSEFFTNSRIFHGDRAELCDAGGQFSVWQAKVELDSKQGTE